MVKIGKLQGNRYIRYVPWAIGTLFVLGGLASVLSPEQNIIRSFFGGVVLLATGLFLLPPLRRRVTAETGREFSKVAVVGIVLVGIVVAGAILPETDQSSEPDTLAAKSGTPPKDVATMVQTNMETTTPSKKGAQNATPKATTTSVTTASTTTTPTTTTSVTTAATTTRQVNYQGLFRAVVASNGVDVDSLSTDSGVVYLEYRTVQTTQNGIAGEMGTVAGAYAGTVSHGWDVEVMEVTVLDANGTPIGFYRVKSKWAKQYNSGKITSEEYSMKVLKTLEANE